MSNNKPLRKIRSGSVTATIWKNEPDANRQFPTYNIVLERSYKLNEEWKTTNSYGVNDLQKALIVISEAQKYLLLKDQQEENKEDLPEPVVVEEVKNGEEAKDRLKQIALDYASGKINKETYESIMRAIQ